MTTLKNEIIHDTVAHAYLFSGPRGVGKTTTARLLAKAVNCQNRDKNSAEPCNNCSSCGEINAGHHIDVIEVDAASQTGVDNVRENIIENAQFKPTTAKKKIFIVDEVHMLSTSAFNALLKTLEEPPAHVVFILATTELHKLPATVISRCQRFHFKKIRYEQMLKRLKKISTEEDVTVDEEVLDRIIVKSDGCLRDAESLLGQIFSLNLKKVTTEDAELVLPTSNSEIIVEFVEHLLHKETKEAILLIQKEIDDGQAPDQFAYTTIELLRVMLVVKTTGTTKLYQSEYSDTILKRIDNLAKKTEMTMLVKLIEQALVRRAQIKTSPLPQLPLELLAAEASIIGNETFVPPLIKETKNETKEKTEIKETKPTPVLNTDTTAIFETIKNQWNTIVEKISETNRSLTFILKMCGLKEISNNQLTLLVPYLIHKEKLEEAKSRHALEIAIENAIGQKIAVVCEVQEKPTENLPDNELNTLAVAFGGQVVD